MNACRKCLRGTFAAKRDQLLRAPELMEAARMARYLHRYVGRAGGEPEADDRILLVLEAQPPRRLVITWADPQDRFRKDRHSRVTFEIEPVADMVRLTVTHDELEAGSEMHRKISQGWPRVLSSLKSLLETGRALQTWAGH